MDFGVHKLVNCFGLWRYRIPLNKMVFPASKKPAQSQQNNIRASFSEPCSNITFQTLNRFLSGLSYLVDSDC